jgi:hypothetical protein
MYYLCVLKTQQWINMTAERIEANEEVKLILEIRLSNSYKLNTIYKRTKILCLHKTIFVAI